MPVFVIYITSAMLLIAVAPLPYGYYTLLRLVVTGVFAWAGYITYKRNNNDGNCCANGRNLCNRTIF
ncbi:unnamed protein product [marine sediment metagenome]|uniref:Uncharacterized protein n=1 Tax=marine sediment metagenome TaxID=412755 RepID=X1AS31_9ZZZZ